MEIAKDGTLELGTYEGAMPHIGEAVFTVKAQKRCSNFNEAFQLACQVGGKKILIDLFSADQIPKDMIQPVSNKKDDFSLNLSEKI